MVRVEGLLGRLTWKFLIEVSLIKDDPLIVRLPWGIISSKRIGELMLRYMVPLKYMCRIPIEDEYIYNLDSLEVVVCEETFQAKFCLPLYSFI